MNTYHGSYLGYEGFSPEEMNFLQQAMPGLTDEEKKRFYYIYSTKRKNPQEVLLFTLLGFIGFAGIHRFVLGQVGMGILYFFTGGFFFIGTIIDVIKNLSITLKYNKKMAYKSYQIVKMSS